MSSETYEAFLDRIRRVTTLQDAAGVLRWDQEVMMPEGGTQARSTQLATMSAVRHDLLTESDMAQWIATLDETSLDESQAAILREIRREHTRATAVPQQLVETISKRTGEAHPAWRDAKEADDFDQFAPILAELVHLKQEYAEHIDPDREPYAVLFDDFEPYLGLETVDQVLTELREALVPLLEAIQDSDVTLAQPFTGTYAVDRQKAVTRKMLDQLGYDWSRGRLDTAPHPFTSGTQFDARITTRFDVDDPLSAITSTIHEFGHALYTQGLPDDEYGTPLGTARDLAVHESQSRFWENHIGRSKPFWDRMFPVLADRFPAIATTSPQAVYEAANTVDPTTLIRVEADELSYHLHIIIRYEIERALINGELDVGEVPAVWNDKYESYLGVRPETDTEGCLQDIHWSHGQFGYFPTYSLGSVLAAQIDATLRADLNVDDLVAQGEFAPLRSWLTDQIHTHGSRYRTNELIERVTDKPLTAAPFIDYAQTKYGNLYDLEVT